MKLPAHGRYDYVPITTRPVYDWPEREQLAAECFASEDYAEGRTAFTEKRRPAFNGR